VTWVVVDPVEDEDVSSWPSLEAAVFVARQGASSLTGLPPEVHAVAPDEDDESWTDVCIPDPCPPALHGSGWQAGDVIFSIYEGEPDAVPQLVGTCPWCGDRRVMAADTTIFEICGKNGCGGMIVPEPGPATRNRDRRIMNAQAVRDGVAPVIPLHVDNQGET
jgi:ribosomal protein S27AE